MTSILTTAALMLLPVACPPLAPAVPIAAAIMAQVVLADVQSPH